MKKSVGYITESCSKKIKHNILSIRAQIGLEQWYPKRVIFFPQRTFANVGDVRISLTAVVMGWVDAEVLLSILWFKGPPPPRIAQPQMP